jgi:hypothetical protein
MNIDAVAYLKLLHELLGSRGEHDDAAGASVDEPFLHGLVDEGQQRIVVPIHVQQPNLIKKESFRYFSTIIPASDKSTDRQRT